MRKKRIWYLIFSLIVSIAIFIGTFYTTNDITFYIAISLIILPNFLMSRTSKSILMIMNEFANNCDSNLYLKNITNFYKSCYLTKKQKIDSKIFLSSVYLETGDLDTLYQKLNELVDEEKNLIFEKEYLRIFLIFKSIHIIEYGVHISLKKRKAKKCQLYLNKWKK